MFAPERHALEFSVLHAQTRERTLSQRINPREEGGHLSRGENAAAGFGIVRWSRRRRGKSEQAISSRGRRHP